MNFKLVVMYSGRLVAEEFYPLDFGIKKKHFLVHL